MTSQTNESTPLLSRIRNTIMSRSTQFLSDVRRPLVNHPHAQLREDEVRGPISFLNPTRARFDVPATKQHIPKTGGEPATGTTDGSPPALSDAQVEWRSRDNRKGRHILVVPRTHTKADTPQLSTTWSSIRKGLWRMATEFWWWDVSWWIAVLFSVGSAIFIASGFFYWLPLVDKSTKFKGEDIAGGVTAFVGATLFTIGGVLLIVEASNENQSGCFGWALEHAFSRADDSDADGSTSGAKGVNGTVGECTHHHQQGIHKKESAHLQHPTAGRKWEWWPTWHELRDHYLHEIGFLASFILAIGAVVFYISGIMALPWIYNACSQGVLYGVYWLAYLVGGILFVVSSVLYMLETQPKWYKPAPKIIGWWIGTWNLIGSVGWTLSASFGYCSASWCAYQSNLSLLWASVAFLIGSMLLWYESMDKTIVERDSK